MVCECQYIPDPQAIASRVIPQDFHSSRHSAPCPDVSGAAIAYRKPPPAARPPAPWLSHPAHRGVGGATARGINRMGNDDQPAPRHSVGRGLCEEFQPSGVIRPELPIFALEGYESPRKPGKRRFVPILDPLRTCAIIVSPQRSQDRPQAWQGAPRMLAPPPEQTP